MVGNADLSEDGRAHQLEDAKAGLAIPVTLKIHPPLRQNLMLGILYGAVFLNVGINQLVQVSSVSPELFRIAVCLAARKYAGITNAACQRRESSMFGLYVTLYFGPSKICPISFSFESAPEAALS